MGNSQFYGSRILAGFIAKKDRMRLLLWIIGLTIFFICFIPVFDNMLTTSDPTEMAVTVGMMENPAMIAIVGPVYGAANYTMGAMYGNFMFLFSAMLAGVMSIVIVTRNTRHDEELGRLEVIRSLPVGRLSNLASTLIVAVAANIILFVLTSAGMYVLREDGMSLRGCLIFGAGVGAVGIFFAAATAVFCQISANNRTASSLSYAFLMILYIVRAAGDLNNEALALVSPLGAILRTKVFVEDNWWPVLLVLGISVFVAVLAFYLASRRDLGRGLVPEKPGRRHGSFLMNSVYGLAIKLLRAPIIIWAFTLFILAAMYGSVFGDLDGFLNSNEMLKAVFAANTEFSATEQFMSLLMIIMSLIAAIPILNFIGKLGAEEKRGYVENIYSKAVSKQSMVFAYLIPTIIFTFVFQLLSALGFWGIGSQVLDTTPDFMVFLKSAMLYVPPILIFVGLYIVIIAFLPGKTYLVYIYLAYTFFVIYLGKIAGFPEWTTKITPFGYTASYPIEEIKAAPIVVQSIIAAALCIVGIIAYKNREIKTH